MAESTERNLLHKAGRTVISTPSRWETAVRRMLDISVAAGVLMLAIPLLILVSLLVHLDSNGPVLFRQRRVGKDGGTFTLYKIRTMYDNAPELRYRLPGDSGVAPVYKLANDPRITPVGRWLRQFSIDELPQLWNVLCGDMTLVGPRPLPLSDVLRMQESKDRSPKRLRWQAWHFDRIKVKPGLTGLWQVSGRNRLPLTAWIHLDLAYLHRRSLLLDLQILLRTIPAVLRRDGAL